MKKKILVLSLIVLCLLLSGCGKKVEEPKEVVDKDAIEGYKKVATIDCEALSKDIRYMKNGIIITADNEVYAYDIEQKFSNNTNCIKFEDSVQVAMIENDKVYEMNDGKLQQVDFKIEEMEITRKSADFMLNKTGIIKDAGYTLFMQGPKKDGNNTIYGVKGNGNVIYEFEVSPFIDRSGTFARTKYQIKNEVEGYSVPKDEIILDFIYHKDDENYIKDYIKTNKSFYGKRITNSEECKEYVDVKCEYEWFKDKVVSKIIDKIVYLYDEILITKDGLIYNKNK